MIRRRKPLKRSALKPSRKAPKKNRKPIRVKGKRRFPKGENLAWLALVRNLPCIVAWQSPLSRSYEDRCGGWASQMQAAHVQSKGAGGADIGNTVPLCALHHDEQHRIGKQSFEAKYGLDLQAEAKKLAERYEASL